MEDRAPVPCVDVRDLPLLAPRNDGTSSSPPQCTPEPDKAKGNQPTPHVAEMRVPTLQIHNVVQKQLCSHVNNHIHEDNRDEDERMANGTNGKQSPESRDQTDHDTTKWTRRSRRHAIPRETQERVKACRCRPRARTRKESQGLFLHPETEIRRTTSRTPRVVPRTKTYFP